MAALLESAWRILALASVIAPNNVSIDHCEHTVGFGHSPFISGNS